VVGDGEPVGFVKLSPNEGVIDNERKALELLERAKPRSFSAPLPLDAGEVDGWHYLTTTAIKGGIHRPADAIPVRAVTEDIQAALEELPRHPNAEDDWQPIHGDLAPWNLRRIKDGSLVLVDWEHASWGPRGTDEVFYLVTDAALRGAPVGSTPHRAAVAYWLRELALRPYTPGTDRLWATIDSHLHGMAQVEVSHDAARTDRSDAPGAQLPRQKATTLRKSSGGRPIDSRSP
jgi:hypothetical protein